MPLLSSGLVVVTPAPEEVATPPTVAYFQPAGMPSFSWIDPDGVEWPLSNISEDLGWHTITGPSGWGAAPIEFATDALADGGENIRHIQEGASTIQWPMAIFGRTYDEFAQRWDRLSRAFKLTTRRRAPGLLRVARPGGVVRVAECFYEAGLGGEPGQNHLFARPVITLRCPEGKWRAESPVVVSRTFTPTIGEPSDPEDPDSAVPVSFFAPFLSVTSSRVVGGGSTNPDTGEPDETGGDADSALTSIVNPGDVEAWPVWTLTGPLTRLHAWNETLGSRFALSFPLSEQQTITITTRPSTVRGPGDANLSKHIDWFNPAGTELWPLADGTNTVGLEVDGAGPTTSVRLEFTPRYDGA
jgi:hypothetical protein